MQEDALFKLTHGLYILGAKDNDGRLVGSCIDAVMQVANKPLVLGVSCGNGSNTKRVVEETGLLSISVLSKKTNPYIVADFGFQSSKSIDKWDYVDYKLESGLPVLEDCVATFVGKVIEKKPFNSNTLFLVEVIDAKFGNDEGDLLTYNNYRDYFKTDVIASFVKNEDTSVLEPRLSVEIAEQSSEANNNEKWSCCMCGYVYDEAESFENLPDDWACPLCGVDKSYFSKCE